MVQKLTGSYRALALAGLFGSLAVSATSVEAATCAVANGSTNTVSTSCYDLSWTNGSLTITNGTTITLSATIRAIDPSNSTVTGLTIDSGATVDGGVMRAIFASNATIGTITNNGTITSTSAELIYLNNTNVTTITNTGTISSGGGGLGGANAISIFNGSTVGTLNNITGTILGGSDTDYASFQNRGTLTTLNNGQSGFTFGGTAPANYNIAVASTSSFGTLTIKNTNNFAISTMNFGIVAGSVIQNNHTYDNVIQAASDSSFDSTATKTGSFTSGANTYSYSLVWDGAAWDLVFGTPGPTVSATNSLAMIQANARGLASVYNQQVSSLQAGLSYDCGIFDKNNLCVSVGGRYSYADSSPTGQTETGLVIVSYRAAPGIRIGAFADQSLDTNNSINFRQTKNSPMWGLFAAWNMNESGQGLAVQVSAVSSDSSLTATRSALSDTEAGSGKTPMRGQGYRLLASYQQAIATGVVLVPYAGLQFTRLHTGAYSESATTVVTAPLSYNGTEQKSFSAIAGLGMQAMLTDKLSGSASVGIQQALDESTTHYKGTSSIVGLETFDVQLPDRRRSMATASAGLAYHVSTTERIGLGVQWQQQAFKGTSTTTALATYSIGF